jgi:hypothetical protein
VIVYTVGDVLTLFLTQLIWMPLELAFNGYDYTAVVDYERRESDEKWAARNINEFERAN